MMRSLEIEMTHLFRRLSAAALALSLLGTVGAEDVFAQTARVAPAGGTSSTTAPSNGEGTPSGGTGNLSTTRVGPSSVAPMAAPATPMASPSTPYTAPRRRRARHRRAVRHTAPAPAATSN